MARRTARPRRSGAAIGLLIAVLGATSACGGRAATEASAAAPTGVVVTAVPTTTGQTAPPTTELVSTVAPSTSSAPATTPPPTLPDPVPDPTELLVQLADRTGLRHSRGIISHECGDVAYLGSDSSSVLVGWTGVDWEPIESANVLLADLPTRQIEQDWITDVTGDGQPEIIVQLRPEGEMRAFGGVLTAAAPACGWHWALLVDSCGDYLLYDAIGFDANVGLVGSGFSGGCSVREGVSFQWMPDVSRFVGRPLDGALMCPEYDEQLDLPLLTCGEGWPISMVQESLAANGYDVDVDGSFGPGTQLALMRYQADSGLIVNGVVDAETWTRMYPPSSEFPDFDGDGVASPREIGHATGATEYVGTGDSSAPAVAVPRSAPYVVETLCEVHRSGLVSDMRGELVSYKIIEVMSDGTRRTASMGSSWDNFPSRCAG